MSIPVTSELLPTIAEHLKPDDDCELWSLATTALLHDATLAVTDAREEIYAQIGCCHHWIRPHQSRWRAGGGFAWPFGYNKTTKLMFLRALPDFTWSVHVKWTGEFWEPASMGKRCLLFRVAIPGRTARHQQAAIHTIWTPHAPDTREKVTRLYGFRKEHGHWSLTVSEELLWNRRVRRR